MPLVHPPVPRCSLIDAKRLRAFFEFYRREQRIHGPTYGTRRHARGRMVSKTVKPARQA